MTVCKIYIQVKYIHATTISLEYGSAINLTTFKWYLQYKATSLESKTLRMVGSVAELITKAMPVHEWEIWNETMSEWPTENLIQSRAFSELDQNCTHLGSCFKISWGELLVVSVAARGECTQPWRSSGPRSAWPSEEPSPWTYPSFHVRRPEHTRSSTWHRFPGHLSLDWTAMSFCTSWSSPSFRLTAYCSCRCAAHYPERQFSPCCTIALERLRWHKRGPMLPLPSVHQYQQRHSSSTSQDPVTVTGDKCRPRSQGPRSNSLSLATRCTFDYYRQH